MTYFVFTHSPGFAKKTFISYSVSFKESFRQGLVVEIDLKKQMVLLENGEVSTGADLSISCFRRTWLLVGGDLGGSLQGFRESSMVPKYPPYLMLVR